MSAVGLGVFCTDGLATGADASLCEPRWPDLRVMHDVLGAYGLYTMISLDAPTRGSCGNGKLPVVKATVPCETEVGCYATA